MSSIEALQERYERLDRRFETRSESAIDAGCLMAFDYDYAGHDAEVAIDTEEFTAVCPWTGLPDFGTLTIRYVPDEQCIELKSLKYYLLSYMGVGIVHEHVANRILDDLVAVCKPVRMSVELDYNVRGGLHASVTARYGGDS
jgi:7-cyano-7-deazaguanine reductase